LISFLLSASTRTLLKPPPPSIDMGDEIMTLNHAAHLSKLTCCLQLNPICRVLWRVTQEYHNQSHTTLMMPQSFSTPTFFIECCQASSVSAPFCTNHFQSIVPSTVPWFHVQTPPKRQNHFYFLGEICGLTQDANVAICCWIVLCAVFVFFLFKLY
jgi:hypothetical protein